MDKLFGTLQTPLKPSGYEGVSTDTIDTFVDNKSRKISSNLNPDLLETIKNNVANISYINSRIIDLKSELAELDQELDKNYSTLKSDINQLYRLSENIESNINSIKEEYATQKEVKQWIDEARVPEAELLSYAKIDYVDSQVDNLQNELNKTSELLTENIESTSNIAEEANADAKAANNRIDMLEAAIGPINPEITLKEEINQTFATKLEIEELAETANMKFAEKDSLSQYATIQWVDDQNFIDAKELESEDYASKSYVNKLIEDIVLGETDIELSNYYTKAETDDKLENYATHDDVSKAISEIDIPDTDLSEYYTKTEISTLLTDTLSAITLIEATID